MKCAVGNGEDNSKGSMHATVAGPEQKYDEEGGGIASHNGARARDTRLSDEATKECETVI